MIIVNDSIASSKKKVVVFMAKLFRKEAGKLIGLGIAWYVIVYQSMHISAICNQHWFPIWVGHAVTEVSIKVNP